MLSVIIILKFVDKVNSIIAINKIIIEIIIILLNIRLI